MTHPTRTTLGDRFDQAIFDAIYSRALVYNTCWEDPSVDRQVLGISPDDHMLVITSAGCNVLDYALLGPQRIHSVDANPRQNALLALKLAGIRLLDYDDFFAAFGRGYHPNFRALYLEQLRDALDPFARGFWDRRVDWFGNPRGSFYFHGLSGTVARGFRGYLQLRPRLAAGICELFETRSLEQQREIYDKRVEPLIWGSAINWALSRQFTMSMLGVPHPQRKEVQTQHERGVAGFVRDAIDYVFRHVPVWTNYFWMVYVQGHYTENCCPEYLKPENFARLRDGLADRICVHTKSVQGFLDSHDGQISRFVLLDHMDWLSDRFFPLLEAEWQAIVQRAASGARVIWRSGGLATNFLDQVQVRIDGRNRNLPELLTFHDDLARELHAKDRVHTYGSFYIADLATSS